MRTRSSKIFIVLLILFWIFSGWPKIQEAQAAVPTYQAKGTFTSGAGALSVPVPVGYQDNDVFLLFVESANQAITTPTGWTQVANSPQYTGAAAAAGGVRLAVFYKVVSGSQSNVSVADSGNHTTAIIANFRGVDTSSPIHLTAGSVDASATASLSAPSLTTTIAETMIVNAIGLDKDAADTDTISSVANANLTNVTERHDQTVSSGVGGGIAFITGEKASAGSTGNTTATGDSSTTHAYITIALKPVPVTLSISVSPLTWGVGTVDEGTVQISTSGDKIGVTNDGNVAETFTLQIYDEDDRNEWTHSSLKTGVGNNIYVLSGIFCATADSPTQTNFNEGDSEDVLTTAAQTATSTKFAYAGGSANAVAVPVSGQRSLWLRLDMPTAVSGTYAYEQHAVTVRISCQQS